MLHLSSPRTHSKSSTAFVAELLEELLGREIPSSSLRDEYQQHFAAVAALEYGEDSTDKAIAFLERALALLADNVVDEHGTSVTEIVRTTTRGIRVEKVVGNGAPVPLRLSEQEVQQWIAENSAEPSVLEIAQSQAQPDRDDILVAIGAGAELAPTKDWLAAGGTVAAVMRPNTARWQELRAFAAQSAGTLLIPYATDEPGIDVVTDLDAAAAFLNHVIALKPRRLIVGGYIYVGGAAHVVAQAAQDALMSYAQESFADTVLTWLATPTDQTPLSLDVLSDCLDEYVSRSVFTKLRDRIWQLFGHCTIPTVTLIPTPHHAVALRDCSATMQGPNYMMAKRAQRWRAYISAMRDRQVTYLVTPPARTHSVLDFKILHATYRGAPHFSMHPFTLEATHRFVSSSLAHSIEAPLAFDELDPTAIHQRFAVHGGLWRVPYEPVSVWVPATIRGALALVLPKRI